MSMETFLAALGLQLLGGALGAGLARRPRLALGVGAAGAVAGGILGLVFALSVLLGSPAAPLDLPWPVPGGRLSLGADPLSAAFLVPIFGLSGLLAVYGVEYLGAGAGRRGVGGQIFFYNLLAASMALVATARDGVLFLVAWEVMSLASFFLVAHEHDKVEVREAARLYLIAMHLGAMVLLAFFALWARQTGSFALRSLPAGALAPAPATALFALALAGFGAKAGFWPLHVWLPKAHPAAPSHVSALMSGVMIKTGVYGVCRTLWLLGPAHTSWALALLAIGAVSGVLGVLSALAQHDLKALLAYHSEENIGIIALGLGVGALGSAAGRPAVAAAGYAGALLHVWNHGLFKGLLFLGAGSVLHATGTRNLEKLGGLWKRMPWTGATFLVGAAAICGLPPFNGLVSEWLVYTAFFAAGTGEGGALGLVPLGGAAVLALIGGLALACFAKAVGVVFLGEPRTARARSAHEAGPAMRWPMAALAAACLGIGLLPVPAVGLLARAVATLDPAAGAASEALARWGAPLARVGLASAGVLALAGLVLLVRRALLHGRAVAESPTWDCGYAAPTPRMQYTASSFAQPLVGPQGVFSAVVGPQVHMAPPRGWFPSAASFESHAPDAAEARFWEPLFQSAGRGFAALRLLQTGRLHHYLGFLLAGLVALLVWALA
ncbi:MAG: proton-conducting transporter membrane subunit [Deferrisomatales bacterium]